MRVLIFGATGMVGQGVLRECLRAEDVERVMAVGRTPIGGTHARLAECVHADLFDYRAIADRLSGFDACFFCLGVSSSGMDETTYTRLTHELTLAAARALVQLDPAMTFVYLSGAGADSSENSRTMWKRVRGRTENELLQLPFKQVAIFRPGIIQPLHGIRSKTAAYRRFYAMTTFVLPLLRRLLPNTILSTEVMGRAMLAVARVGAPRRVLESGDIAALGHAAT